MINRSVSENVIKYKIDYRSFTKLQNIVVSRFGFKHISEVRDKFEGQAFLNKFLTRSFAEIAFQRILKENQFSLDIKEKNINYKPEFRLGELTIELLCSTFDSPPLLPKTTYDIGIFFYVDLFSREASLTGFACQEEIFKSADRNISPLLEKANIGFLKNMDIVKPLASYPESSHYFKLE